MDAYTSGLHIEDDDTKTVVSPNISERSPGGDGGDAPGDGWAQRDGGDAPGDDWAQRDCGDERGDGKAPGDGWTPPDSDDDDEDDDAYDDEEDETSTVVWVRHPDGHIIYVYARSDHEVSALKLSIKNLVGIRTSEQRLTYEDKTLEDGTLLSAYSIQEGRVVNLTMRIRGGGFMTKKHITKEAAVKAMAKHYSTIVKKNLFKNIDADPNELNAAPPPLQAMMLPIATRLTTLRGAMNNDAPIIQPLLEKLPDNRLQSLIDMLSRGKCGTKPEDRMEQIAVLLTTDIQVIDEYINQLYKFKGEALELFIELYSREYSFERGGTLLLQHDKLLSEAQGVANYRRGIRRMSNPEAMPEAAEGGAEPDRCTIC